MINFSTGPVNISTEVKAAFSKDPISHRSPKFLRFYKQLTAEISSKIKVKETILLTGSGTLANELMIAQIGLRKQRGMILSNGEFGNRLTDQASRQGLDYEVVKVAPGLFFSVSNLADHIKTKKISWLLFCHCESSTGIINQLSEITTVCNTFNCDMYVDCMSTFGAMPLDLSMIAMGTASSGKALGAYAGIALIFCNAKIRASPTLPLYLDLYHASLNNNIPFTISSNMLAALATAVEQNLDEKRWNQLNTFSSIIFHHLHSLDLAPYSSPQDRIFTIVSKRKDTQEIALLLEQNDIKISWESNYLLRLQWLQIALFSTYTQKDIDHLLTCINKAFSND